MSNFQRSARKALATFIFATIGSLLTVNGIFDADLALWKTALGSGIGAVLNLVYRWAEAVKDEDAAVRAHPANADRGAADVLLLVIAALAFIAGYLVAKV